MWSVFYIRYWRNEELVNSVSLTDSDTGVIAALSSSLKSLGFTVEIWTVDYSKLP